MQKSDLNYNISFGKANTTGHNYSNFKNEDGVMKTGANIEWNGGKMMSLGHEMGHGYDAMNGFDIASRNIDNDFQIPLSEVRGTHMENILNAEQGIVLRTHYLTLEGGGYDLSKPALVKDGKEVRFGYDYRRQIVPYNYGRGIYLRENPYIRPLPVQPLKLNR